MTKLLFVHGINNQGGSAKAIKSDWAQWIVAGLSKAGLPTSPPSDVRAAFYGDLLARATEVRSSNPQSGVAEMGPIDREFTSKAVASLYVEVQNIVGLSDEVVQGYNETNIAPMGDGIHKSWLKAIARALEDTLPSQGKYLARVFLPQASAYLDSTTLRRQIDSLVREQIFQDLTTDVPVVIVSHSLGTIVSYSILRELGEKVRCPLFLTLGSPLGIEIVKQCLHPIRKRPEGVKLWVNGSDLKDFVALHPKLDADTFGSNDIENITSIQNNNDDRHSIEGYLQNTSIAQTLADTFSDKKASI